MAAYSSSAAGIKAKIGVKHYGEGSFTTTDAHMSGTWTTRLNAAADVKAIIQNPRGTKGLTIIPSDKIQLTMATTQAATGNRVFEGIIPMNGAKQGNHRLQMAAYDYISTLNKDPVYLDDDDNLDGEECGKAIEKLVNDADGSYFTAVNCDNTDIGITTENEIRSDFDSRKKVIDAIVGAVKKNSSTPLSPKQFYYYQMPDTTFRGFLQDDTRTSVMTLTKADVLSFKVNISSSFCNSASINGTGIRFKDSDSITRFGVHHKKLEKLYDQPADNWEYARSYVTQNKTVYYTYTISHPALLHIPIGNYVTVEKMKGGADGKYIITEKAVKFSPTNYNVTGKVAALTPIIV